MAKTRIALVGFGVIGKKHAAALISSKTCKLSAIVDTDPSAESFAKKHNAQFHTTLNALFSNTFVDGVVLATPNSLHAEQAIICAKNKVHVLIEKPIATTMDEARSIITTSREAKTKVLSGHYRRFNKQLEKAREIVLSEKIGTLIGVSAIWAMKKHDDYYNAAWRTQRGGGPILTNLIHDVDSLRWICGDIVEISSHLSNNTRKHEVEDTAAIALRFKNGALGTILLSDAAPSPWSYEATTGENMDFAHMDDCCYRFIGTKGSIDFPLIRIWTYPNENEAAWHFPMLKTQQLEGAGNPLQDQIEHFGKVIRGEEPPRTSGEDGARTLSTTLAIVKAASKKQTVSPDGVE